MGCYAYRTPLCHGARVSNVSSFCPQGDHGQPAYAVKVRLPAVFLLAPTGPLPAAKLLARRGSDRRDADR